MRDYIAGKAARRGVNITDSSERNPRGIINKSIRNRFVRLIKFYSLHDRCRRCERN